VVHWKLLLKLKPIIPNRFLLAWISRFLSGRTQTVIVNNSVSSPVNVTSGLAFHKAVSYDLHTLFLLYINELEDCIKHSQITLLMIGKSIICSSEKQALLQQDLENLSFWAKTWQMYISLTKTNVLYLASSNPKFVYSLEDVLLEDSGESCKDLHRCVNVAQSLFFWSYPKHCFKRV